MQLNAFGYFERGSLQIQPLFTSCIWKLCKSRWRPSTSQKRVCIKVSHVFLSPSEVCKTCDANTRTTGHCTAEKKLKALTTLFCSTPGAVYLSWFGVGSVPSLSFTDKVLCKSKRKVALVRSWKSATVATSFR